MFKRIKDAFFRYLNKKHPLKLGIPSEMISEFVKNSRKS